MGMKYKQAKSLPQFRPPKQMASMPKAEPTTTSPAAGGTSMFKELGTPGLDVWYGFVYKAYNADLYWPDVYELYNRLRRSNPEISITRQIFGTVGGGIGIKPDLPERPSDDDKRFQEFYSQVLDDIEGGIARWRNTFIAYVPFMGWAWWEAVPAIRRRDWIPPDDDSWRSKYDDGLIGFRRFGLRDHSTFDSWKLNDSNGRLAGMWQSDAPNPRILLPLDRSIHCTFGDVENPEGLTPLEAIWRLERIKYGLEIINGIGFEHAAGYLDVIKESIGEITNADKNNIKAAARSILTAQEGNYALWPNGFKGDVKDVPFSAAPSLLEAVRYYSMLTLALYNMQWVAMSTVSATGSYAALKDSTALWLVAFNQMIANGVEQLDEQIGARLLKWNRASFPGITRRSKLKAEQVKKLTDLSEIAQLVQAFGWTLPMGPDDQIEIRRRTEFLPETLPQSTAKPAPDNAALSGLTRELQAARRELQAARRELAETKARQLSATHLSQKSESSILEKVWETLTAAFKQKPGDVTVNANLTLPESKIDTAPIADALSKQTHSLTVNLPEMKPTFNPPEITNLNTVQVSPTPPGQTVVTVTTPRIRREKQRVTRNSENLMTGSETEIEYDD